MKFKVLTLASKKEGFVIFLLCFSDNYVYLRKNSLAVCIIILKTKAFNMEKNKEVLCSILCHFTSKLKFLIY